MSDLDSETAIDVFADVPVPGPDVKGLELAEHYFGPLLSPVAATEEQWTAYVQLRRVTNMRHRTVFVQKRRMITNAVADLEKDMQLNPGTLQKCLSVMDRFMNWVEDDYIDVRIKYHHRARMSSVEWFYSLGYKIGKSISSPTIPFDQPTMKNQAPAWHARDGWQSIAWGYYDDPGNWGPRWRTIEVARMGLHAAGVREVHETLFGPIEYPPNGDAHAELRYRRKLVSSVRFLLAAVGIAYKVACTEDEKDRRAKGYVLEGLSDLWVARDIRKACGFQLSGDPGAEMLAQAERDDDDSAYDYSDFD